jgi:hypothetical protein
MILSQKNIKSYVENHVNDKYCKRCFEICLIIYLCVKKKKSKSNPHSSKSLPSYSSKWELHHSMIGFCPFLTKSQQKCYQRTGATSTHERVKAMGVSFLFFFNFVMWPQWQSSTRGMSQSWVQVREESRIFLESSYILAICKNPLSKYDYFRILFCQSCYFFIKNILCALSPGTFLGHPSAKRGKKNWLESLWKSIRFELLGPIVGRWNGAIHWASERTKLCQISNNKRYQEKTTNEEGYHERKKKKKKHILC